MDKFSSAPESKKLGGIPYPPKECKCSAQAAVVLLTVIDSGKYKTGAFGQFGYYGKNGELLLQDRYEYQNWDAKCAECFTKTRRPEQVSSFTENEIRRAWMWFISKITEGTKLAMFSKQPATPEQEEKFLRIVNIEAKRTNQPDAIPDGYKLREVWG